MKRVVEGRGSPASPEATGSRMDEMLLSELYELQKRVDEVERMQGTPSPSKSVPRSSALMKGEGKVEFTSPSTPLIAAADVHRSESPGRRGKAKALKRKKRRTKRTKAAKAAKGVSEEILERRSSPSSGLTMHDLSSSRLVGRKSPDEASGSIPWAKTPTRSLPTR